MSQITAHPAVVKWEQDVKARMQEQAASKRLGSGEMMSTKSGKEMGNIIHNDGGNAAGSGVQIPV